MENKVKLLVSKKINKRTIAISLIILIILLTLTLYIFKNNLFKQEEIENQANKTTYTIENIKDNFLDDYYGNDKTMIVFFASWCKYCEKEKNELNNFLKHNPDKNVILVSHDDSYEGLESFLKTNNFDWKVIFDKDKLIREHIDPGSKGLPSVYLFDNKGKKLNYMKKEMTEQEFLDFYNNEVQIY